MEISEINGAKSLESWLEDKPVEWAHVIAARVALRVLPLAWPVAISSDTKFSKELCLKLVLSSFHASFVSSTFSKYLLMGVKDIAYYSAASADLAASHISPKIDTRFAMAASAAADAAYSISYAVDAVPKAVATAAFYAASAIGYDADSDGDSLDIWRSVRTDCFWLESFAASEAGIVHDEKSIRKQQHDTRQLIVQPLWIAMDDSGVIRTVNRPNAVALAFQEFYQSNLATTTNFGLITDWYDAVLKGKPLPFNKKAELAIAKMSPEGWDDGDEERDCMAVMDRVAELAGWRVKPSASMSDFIIETFTKEDREISIDEFVAFFARAGFSSSRDSIRGRLVELTDKGIVNRLENGIYILSDKNNEIAPEQQILDNLPKLNELPKQSFYGTPISSFKNGPLKPLKDQLALGTDPEQEALYAEVRSLLRNMKEHFPSQELLDCKELIDSFLEQPEKLSDITFVKILWLKGNAIRSKLARHDAVANEDMNYDQLPPAVAEALRAPVDAWNILVIGDQKLRELDTIRKGPREFTDLKLEAEAARPVLEAAAQDRAVLSKDLASIVQMQVEISAAAVANIHGDQALEISNATSQNINGEILSGAYQTVLKVYKSLPTETKAVVLLVGGTIGTGAGSAIGADVWAAVKGSWAYVEFIAANPEIVKHYISIAYGNPALERAVDFIKQLRDRYKP